MSKAKDKTQKSIHDFFNFLPKKERDSFFNILAYVNDTAQKMFEHNPDAPNYLELYSHDKRTNKHYGALTFSRSTAVTPHALRLEAERKLMAIRDFINVRITDTDISTALKELKPNVQ